MISYSILSSRCIKAVELQPMSLIVIPLQPTSHAVNSEDWLGTFWAHSVSTEVNSGESHVMSFRSSTPVWLRGQGPETGSIPGSSTGKKLVRVTSFGQFSFHQHLINIAGLC